MTTKSKLLIGGIVVFVLVLLAYIVKIQHDIITKQREIETKVIEFKQIGDGIARLESRMTTDRKDLEKQLKELGVNYKAIEEDLKSKNAKLDAIAVSIGITEGYKKNDIFSDWQEPIPQAQNQTSPQGNLPTVPNPSECVNKYGYCEKIQGLNLYELGPNNEKIPFGDVGFNATAPAPWNLNVYPRKYYSVLSLGKDDQGMIVAHSQFMIEDNKGVKHKIAVSDKSYVEQVDQTWRFYWWNPRFVGGYSLGIRTDGAISSTIGVQAYMSAYTANKSRPTWMFVGLGGGYDMSNNKPVVSVSPVAYNMFHTTELIQNLYVSPTITMATDSNVAVQATAGIIF